MSTVKIEFVAPNSTVYTVETSDDEHRGFSDSGEALIDWAVYVVKRMAGLTND